MTRATEKLADGLREFARRVGAETPEEAMRLTCRRLLKEQGISRLPIYLRPLLRHLGVDVRYVDASQSRLGNGYANVVYFRNRMWIELEKRQLRTNWRRSRFLIAHEIAHIILFRELRDTYLIESLNESRETYRHVERICDVAAAEILVPQNLLRNALRHTGWGPAGLDYLYRQFDVSRQVLAARLAELLPNGAVFRWRYHARHEAERSTWRVLNVFPFQPNSNRPWLPVGCTEKHIFPRVLDDVFQRGVGRYLDRARVDLGRQKKICKGFCSFFPTDKSLSSALSLIGPGASGTDRPDMFLFLADYELSSQDAFEERAH